MGGRGSFSRLEMEMLSMSGVDALGATLFANGFASFTRPSSRVGQ